MIGRPPSEQPMRHDAVVHARHFAERYAEPMDYQPLVAQSSKDEPFL
jgi:hypothetical protein